MAKDLIMPTAEDLLQAALNYAKQVTDTHLAKGEIVGFVLAFMRDSEEGRIVQFVLPLPQIADTPLKRKQEVRNAGRSFVRQLRAGAPAVHVDQQQGTARKSAPPEIDLQQPLLAMHVVEAWYLIGEAEEVNGRLPSQSPDRKEIILANIVDSTGDHKMYMAPIRRTKRGKALPLAWDKDGPVESSDSPVMYFLLGMAEEIQRTKFN